ncbi:MAG: NAD(P)-binding domain-containing protein [Myxococcales bacterium]|nr:NAD(P)-binding domain-containing protein [Myxococcales bacterium]
MTWVVPLALGSLAISIIVIYTIVAGQKRHRMAQMPAMSVGPRVLIHDINDDRCTGCDACVAVCPTNVLDLVNNKSRVLRFADCIQCEACMFACPTEALVMFPEGAQPPPLKVPEIDGNFQTAVPGQYLIGEVAGKPLVKSAANLGRLVVEHMLGTGLRPGMLGPGAGGMHHVDVAIVGSGPGGLSAALTCINRGLSYVVLEKEQIIASTISRYPKGKLVMAEPYDTANLSLLPVFDSSKEQLIPIWTELIDRLGLRINLGESVESVTPTQGIFEVKSTVAAYRAQRVILAIGTRGKPRTLQVPGENLPKVYNLLEDPDEWRGRSVLVVGGGDSAVEAAMALADAGAKVIISYRGKGFNRAAPKNKQAIEQYAAQGRLKAKLGSQVVAFDPDTVTIALADGSHKKYPNNGAFVLIGADPPVAWLEKVGVRFVERPHQFQLGKTDDLVRRFVQHAIECPEDAARAAAQVMGQPMIAEPPRAPAMAGMPAMQPGMPGVMGPEMLPENMSGPRKWLRSATSIFSNRRGDSMIGQLSDFPEMDRMASRPPTSPGMMAQPMAQPMAPRPPTAPQLAPSMPTPVPQAPARRPEPAGGGRHLDGPVPLSEFARRQQRTGIHHSGHGRRDQLSAGERTRILRMLRDEGGRMADEDSQVYIGSAPGRGHDPDMDDAPAPPPSAAVRMDMAARPAVVVGLAQASGGAKRRRGEPTSPPPLPARSAPPPPPTRRGPELPRPAGAGAVPAFGEQRTRQVDPRLLSAARQGPGAMEGFDEEATRINEPMFAEPNDATQLGAAVDPRAWAFEDSGRHVAPPRPLAGFEDHREEATTLGSMDFDRPAQSRREDRRDGADPRMPNVDWDLE